MLRVTHNAGFFSCCSVRLWEICQYFNKYKKLPLIVDSSTQFKWYKSNDNNTDITYEYFKEYDNDNDIDFKKEIKYFYEDQYKIYKDIDYSEILPFINKYFSPSSDILNIIKDIENKYGIHSYDNISTIFYRGNDKNTETTICSYEDIARKAFELKLKNPNIIFLLQSDESEFYEYMLKLFPNSIYFTNEIRHMPKCMSTVDKEYNENKLYYSKCYLAITHIMAKCKYIICTSGNCSIWIMFFRNNSNNVSQYLNNGWFDSI